MTKTGENSNNFSSISLSGGKDSSALLLLMLEKDMPIDCVLYADTGMEFPEMEGHINKLDDLLYRERGLHITTLRHPRGFEWLMFEEPKQKRSCLENRARLGIPPYGNGWPGIRVRWCTGQLKTHLISKEVNRLKKERNALHHIGIAADEVWRCKDDPRNRYPLVEWGITEAQALQICYDRGFDFGGLYEIYHRASCWCCPFQRIDELRKLRIYHPELWARLRDMDNRARANGGYEYAKQFYEEAFHFIEEKFGADNVISAVMHADEINLAATEDLGKEVYHYHLHAMVLPVVEKEILWSKRCKDEKLRGTVKEVVNQISHSKKWKSDIPLVDEKGNPLLRKNGKPMFRASYSILQDELFNYMTEQGFKGFQRGEYGSTAEHLTSLQYQIKQDKERLDKLQERIQKEQVKYKSTHKISKTFNEIDSMGQKTFTGKMAISKEDYAELTDLAKEGKPSIRAALRSYTPPAPVAAGAERGQRREAAL